MDDEIAKDKPSVHADNHSIAIGEINITGTVTGNITIGHTIVQPADARLRHELGILLKNVETTWIKGVLERSVHEAALLELGLELREEAVDNPWRMVIESPDQARETLPRGRRIKDIFDEANRLLLILGEPGSGKTTTLLQLARDLIAEVDVSTFTQPVPVILNLSTWTNKAQPLEEWLVAELNSKYRLPKKDGQRWLKERRILPLLDGLDEVRVENRAACVEKINQLVVDYGLQGMVVCSRIKDYTALNVRLAFYRAIHIQPLTPEQVNEYLERAGDRLASLRATLQNDEALRSMAQSPLILNVMSLAYQNTSAEDLSDPTLSTNKARRKHLFDTYIARMFSRKGNMQVYDDEQTKHHLSWLARNMQKHNQGVFLIEGLQPSWFSSRRWQWVYFFASRIVTGLSFGLSVESIFTVGSMWYELLRLGLIATLFIGLIDVLRFEWLRKPKGLNKPSTLWWTVINIVVIGLVVGYSAGLIFGLSYGLIFGLRGSRQSSKLDIQTVEALRWSWRKALIGGLIGALFGVLFMLINRLNYEANIDALAQQIYERLYGLIFGLSLAWSETTTMDRLNLYVEQLIGWFSGRRFGLGFGLMGAILYGLRSEIMETKSTPNQGLRLSIRNAIFGGLIFGLIGGLLYGLLFWPDPELGFSPLTGLIGSAAQSVGLTSRLSTGLDGGLGAGLMGALWYGGFDIIQHYTLRLILLIQGHTPANYARFLDYAVDRIFLQKVGGGYRFIHRLLLEHFAEMGEAKKI